MKVILVQNEIEDAIRSYMSSTLSVPAQKELKIEMTATRGASGVTAEINIVDKGFCEETKDTPIEEENMKDPVSEPLMEEKPNIFEEVAIEDKPKKTKSLFTNLQATN